MSEQTITDLIKIILNTNKIRVQGIFTQYSTFWQGRLKAYSKLELMSSSIQLTTELLKISEAATEKK